MSANVPFDKYEAAILLAVCLWAHENAIPGRIAAHVLSKILRDLAQNRGFEFDDSFRSVSGLLYQMRVMNEALSRIHNIIKPRSVIEKAVQSYIDNRDEYERLLSEALVMGADSKNKQAFLKFLTQQKSSAAGDIYLSLISIETIAREKRLINVSLYDDLNEGKIKRIENVVFEDRYYISGDRKTKANIKTTFTLLRAFISSDMYDKGKTDEKKDQRLEHKTFDAVPISYRDNRTTNTTDNTKTVAYTITPDEHSLQPNSRPISFVYYSREITGLLSWTDLYAKFLRILWNEKSKVLSGYIGRAFGEINGAIDIGSANDCTRMRKPVRIADNVFLETDLTDSEVLQRIGKIMSICAIPNKRLTIKYEVKVEATELEKPMQQAETEAKASSTNHGLDAPKSALPDGYLYVDFSNNVDMTYSKPCYYLFSGEKVTELQSWTDLYVKVVTKLWKSYREYLFEYVNGSFTNDSRADLRLGQDIALMTSPKEIDRNICLETNLSAKDIVNKIKALLSICGVPSSVLEIVYTKKERESIPETNEEHKLPQKSDRKDIHPVNPSKLDHEYLLWLKNEAGIAQKSIISFYYATKQCEEYCEKHRLPHTHLLSTGDYTEAMLTADMLLQNKKFHETAYLSNYRHLAALKKYKQFLQSRLRSDRPNEQNGSDEKEGKLRKPAISENRELIDRCLAVLRENFTNGLTEGLKKEDGNYSIKGNRFIRAYSEKYNEEFPQDEDIDRIFKRYAIIYEGKYYALTDECKDEVKQIISDNFDHIIFYYEMLYSAYADILAQYNIHSVEMFKTVLRSVFPKYDYKRSYFTTDSDINDEKAVFIAFADDSMLSLDELKKRLPYMDVDTMRQALRANIYINVGNMNYAILDRLDLSEEDARDSETMIKASIALEGYCMITKLFTERSEIANPSVSADALKEAIFKKFLSDKYSKKYRLIGPLGASMSTIDVLQQYCLDHAEIQLEDIENYERELTGEEPQYSIWAALNSMVRVSEDKFVSHDMIVFDTASIDELIEEYFGERRVISFTNIRSFALFPYVMGYSWNQFLLEGFLLHFSKKWRCSQANSNKNELIGAIYSRKMDYEYEELLAIAVADSGMVLNENNVSDFLLNNGFRRRKPKADKMDALIKRANEIRLKEGG